jgi:hypothetical protein
MGASTQSAREKKMQISSHSLQRAQNQTLKSPPTKAEQTPSNEPVDHFDAAPKEKNEPSYLGMALLGFTAIAGFVAGRATLPQAETVAKQEKCECPTIDLAKDSTSVTSDKGYENPDDWKEELGGGPVKSPERRTPAKKKEKSTRPSAPSRDYEYPDSWKEEIGGGGSRYDSGGKDYDSGGSSSSEQSQDDWQGPDDWKSGF